MSFRRKLLILLLVIALVPLLINGLLHRTTMRRISQQLTTETMVVLQDNATQQLQGLVNNQSLLLVKDRALVIQALEIQAREIESRLSRKEITAADDLLQTYLFVQQQRPELFSWHSTYLESGLQATYPTQARSTDDKPHWYHASKKSLEKSWQLVIANSELQFIASAPIRQKNGQFIGVTAIGLNYQQLFKDWQLPQHWQDQGRLFIVNTEPLAASSSGGLKVLLEIRPPTAKQAGALNAEQRFADAAPPEAVEALIEALQKGRSGVLSNPFAAKESLWVYPTASPEEPFPLLIIPRKLVTLPARQTADYVEELFISGLKWTALLSVGVLLSAIITAIFRARTVTEPITQLAQASEQLSRGDFTTRVDIRSKDEFEALGNAFNRIGPQLKDRQEIKQSLAIAKDIQQRILPASAPQLDNFELAGRIDYCDETGGDYYDYIETGSGKWGLAVGDVVGHGVGAALLMASAAGILHAAIANGEENLEALFSSLNTFLEKDVGDTRFMTLFFALLNPADRSLHWLSAGHGPMFLYRASTESVEELSATTMPLGVMDDVEFKPVQEEHLASGDIFAIGTDGIWETNNAAGEMFGDERFGQLLIDLAQQPAEAIIDSILLEVDEFRGEAPKEDDVTLIILKAK
jgi:sigma-B regulation protein RsbU (phosphoserine phosphatase)